MNGYGLLTAVAVIAAIICEPWLLLGLPVLFGALWLFEKLTGGGRKAKPKT